MRQETKDLLASTDALLDELAELDLEDRINQVLSSAVDGLPIYSCNCDFDTDGSGFRVCEIPKYRLPLAAKTEHVINQNPEMFPDLYGDWVSSGHNYNHLMNALYVQEDEEYSRLDEEDIYDG